MKREYTPEQRQAIRASIENAKTAIEEFWDALGDIEKTLGFMVSGMDEKFIAQEIDGDTDENLNAFLQFATDNVDGEPEETEGPDSE